MPEEDLWEFECPLGHGTFDVWGIDWSDVHPMDRPIQCSSGIFEPSDVTATRCPRCLVTGRPVGPRASLA